jgi:hypothetical protein
MRSTWARLIHKVYEVDPLECPRCKGPMRVIALIDDAAVIRKILNHLGLWARPDLPPRSRHRLNPLRERRVRLAEPVYCPSGAKPIDCHVVFFHE